MNSEQDSSFIEKKRQGKARNHSKSRRIDEEEPKNGESDENGPRQETHRSGCEEFRVRCHNRFINHGYCDADEENEEENEQDVIGELLSRAWAARERLERGGAEWQKHEQELERNKQAIDEDIDRRREEMVRAADEYAQGLHQRVEALFDGKLENARLRLSNVDSALREYDGVFEDSSARSEVKGRLEELRARAEEATAIEVPEWRPLVLTKTDPIKPLLTGLFGRLDGGATGSGWLGGLPGSSADGSEVIAKLNEEATENSPSADDPEDFDNEQIRDTVILRKPTIRNRFSAKTKKERRDIGVTDAAATSAGDVIVIDKHNKLAKMFDAEGRFRRFVGRKLVRAPSRVTILGGSGEILITDNASKSVKVFDPEGESCIGLFADDLDQPISHCQLADGRIAVVDFATRNVFVYERSGRASHHFDTGLRCPAYVAGTRNGNIAVSDWRHSKVRIYDAGGNPVTEMDASSGHGVVAPYGLYGDAHGYLIVSEGSYNGIRIFTEDGVPVANLSPKDYGLKLAMAVCQCDTESLVSVDYQGPVKVIKYADVSRQVVDLSVESRNRSCDC